MSRTPQQRPGGPLLNRVACDVSEAAGWRGRAVVIDLFRFSNTLCALLESGRRDVAVYASPELAVAAGRASGGDIFSEMDLPGVEKYDNSPAAALKGPDPSRPAVVVTNSGSKAVMACSGASEVLVGCFANSAALRAYCAVTPRDTLFVPACLYYDRSHVEDFICARYLSGAVSGGGSFEEALAEIHASGRPLDFLARRPEGRPDLDISLSADLFSSVPSAFHRGIFASVRAAGPLPAGEAS